MPIPRPPTARAWLSGALLGLLAVGLRAAAQPMLGNQLPFVLAFVATVLGALLWGFGPGLLVAVITAAAVALPMLPPDLPPDERPVTVGGFLIAAVVLSLLCGQLGRTRSLERAPAPDELPDTPLTVWLRAVLWGALLIPLAAFFVIAWWGFERAERDARDDAMRAAELLRRHAESVFAAAKSIAIRVDAAVAGDDATLLANEEDLHRRLSDMRVGVPSVVNLNVWGARGQALVGSDNFPVSRDYSVADRAYFLQQRDAPLPLALSEVLTGRQSGRELFNATVRRSSPEGAFRGIVAVSLTPDYFRDYYKLLVTEAPKVVTFALLRDDGLILARWPPSPDGRQRVPADHPILQRVQAGETSGTALLPATPGREARISAFGRVRQAPAYVVAGFGRDAMLAEWVRFTTLLAAVMAPVTAGLVYVTWVAIRRTRREQATAVELREEIRRRGSAEHAMLEQQRLETLSALTGGVAHDFNNLLAIVGTNLHLHRKLHPDQAAEPQLRSMQRAIQSGARLTRQLLSFSRRQTLQAETLDLQNWLRGTEELLKSTLGAGVALALDVDADTAPIHVDAAELELALINLALNARHALPEGGRFRVHARNADGGLVEICAHDDGGGIAPDVLPRVLEPFYTTRPGGTGSGLGLSQVNGLATEAGGHVKVESKLGEGTTVRIFLPAAAAPAAPPAADAPAAAEAPLAGRVLVVEDNDEVAAATVALLRGAGLDVVRKPDAQSALALLRSRAPQPDAVLTDIAMPGPMNGIDLAFALRGERPALPVLLTTGYAEQIERASEGGFRVLRKPAEPAEVLAALREALAAEP